MNATTENAVETAERATQTAERYADAIVRISELLNDEGLTDKLKVLRVRMVLISLDSTPEP